MLNGTTRRRILAGGLAAGFGGAAAACVGGATGSGQPASKGPAAGKATLTGTVWMLDHPLQMPVRKALEQRVADFEKAFPGAKVEYDGVVEPNDNQEKFQILVAAGTMPDASATHTAFLQQYQHFSDLSPYLAKDKSLKAEDYFPTIFGAFKVPVNNSPRQIGIPREVHATIVYYSKPALSAVGLKEPTKDWTHTEFVEMGLKLTEWKSDPQQAKWAIENATNGLTGSQQGKFGTGRFKMYASNQNTAPVGTNAVSFDWDMVPIPQVPGKKRATRMAGNAYGIITQGKNKNPDLAWELIKFFVGE